MMTADDANPEDDITPVPIAKSQAIARLRAIVTEYGNDFETSHQEADAVLLGIINDPEVTAAWNEVGKWWA